MQQQEFLDIVLPLKDKLFRMAKRILVSHDEAQDAVQEVFLKLWNGRHKMKTYKNPDAFAMTMTKNYCLDRLKSRQASNLKIVHSNYTSSNESLEDHIEAKDGVSLLLKIMETLPKQQQMVLQLRDVEQYEYKDISKMLDLNETAVRVTLSRARKTLRTALLKTYKYGVN